MPNEVVCVYSMNDGVTTYSEKHLPIFHNELSLIIPKRLVSELRDRFPEARVILEAHDALLFAVRIEYVDDFIPIAKKEMERPINFTML